VAPVATAFILSSLIACAFAHLCSITQSGKRTAASFRWIPRLQRPRDADNLPFAGRSKVTVERLGGSLAALVYHAREPTNVVTGEGNYVLPKRMPRGRTPWFATRFSRVTDDRTTTMLRRDGVRFSTPWKPS
jgi:hypothetical protein